MNLQQLNIGDTVVFRGHKLIVVDFSGYKEPIMHALYGKVYATPLFQRADGSKQTIHEAYWDEIVTT